MIKKKLNPDANPDNALEMYERDGLCCVPEIAPRDYSVLFDTTDTGANVVTRIAIDGKIFDFSQAYSTIDAADGEKIEDEIVGFLETLGYEGRPTVTYSVDEFSIQVSDSEAHFEWVGNYYTFIAFQPNVERRFITAWLNEGVVVPIAGMTLTVTEFTKNGETVTDVQGKTTLFLQNATSKENVLNWLNTLFKAHGIWFDYHLNGFVIYYETGIGDVAGAPNDRIPFKFNILRSDDTTNHEIEQTVGSPITYKENAVGQALSTGGIGGAW